MALSGIGKSTRGMGFKAKSAGPWGEGKPERPDGVGKCGHYDVELADDGNCRDQDCKRDRLIAALHSGEAMKTPDGTIIWTPGHKIRK